MSDMEKKPIILCHRGARHHAPENSISAFRKAIELEVDGVEFDVMSTADGLPVVIHDDNLSRLAGRHVHVHKTPYVDLKDIDIGRTHNPYFTSEYIPTLKETLDVFRGSGLRLDIEIKKQRHQNGNFLKNTLQTIKDFGMEDQVMLSSFSREVIYQVGRLEPGIERALLLAPGAFFFLDVFVFANMLAVRGLNPHVRLLSGYLMKYARLRGFKIFTWTANDPEDIRKALRLGVDGIITDDPVLVKEMMSYGQ